MFIRNIERLAIAAFLCIGIVTAASAATTVSLLLPGSLAFTILGTSCGGIQEQVFATGFDENGSISGVVFLHTRCGMSGRGGGYRSRIYSSWVAVTWDLSGKVLNYNLLPAAPKLAAVAVSPVMANNDITVSPVFAAFDEKNEEIYNSLSTSLAVPANCTVENVTSCKYRGYVNTP